MPGAWTACWSVSVEQAVAAPYCAARLADAGARVLKIERPEGDFARGYDFLCTRLGRAISCGSIAASSPVALDSRRPEDLGGCCTAVGKADVLNPEPRARCRPARGLRLGRHARQAQAPASPSDISGYGDPGPYKDRRAYDLLVQAESGMASINRRTEHAPGRSASRRRHRTGMYAHAAVLEALIARGTTARAGRSRSRCSRLDGRMDDRALLSRTIPTTTGPRLGSHPYDRAFTASNASATVPISDLVQTTASFHAALRGRAWSAGLDKDPLYATNKARMRARRHQRHRANELRPRRLRNAGRASLAR